MITKKLKGVVFAWDPNAFSGRGYWYVLGSKGGLGRAASKTERLSLGKPNEKDVIPESPKVYDPSEESSEETESDGKKKSKKEKRKEHEYGKAEDIRKTSIGDLIAKNLVEGKGVGESIKGGVTDKIKAVGTGIKEKFDPMNMAKSIGGNLGAALYGKATGRSQQDIEYFTGMEKDKPKKKKKKTYDKVEGKDQKKKKNPLNTTIGAGSRPLPLRKNDSVSDVAAKLFSLLRKSYEDKKLQMELDKNFEDERKEEAARRHKEFIEALLGIKPGEPTATAEKSSGFDFLKMVGDLVDKLAWLTRFASLAELIGAILIAPEFLAAVGLALAGGAAYYIAKKLGENERERVQQLGGEKATAAVKEMNAAPMNENQGGTFESPTFEPSPEFNAAQKKLDAANKEKQDIVAGLMSKKGYKRFYKTGWFGDRLKNQYTFEDKNGKPATDEVLKQVSEEADRLIKEKDATATPASAEKTTNGALQSAPDQSEAETKRLLSIPSDSKVDSVPTPNALGDKMSQAIKENNSLENNYTATVQPIALNDTKVYNTQGTDQSFSFDPAAVRNQDQTLYNIQKKFTRYV